MRDDYLWDGSGEPDPEVQRLERILARLRSRRLPPELPADLPRLAEISPVPPIPSDWETEEGTRKSFVPILAAAAAVMITILGTWFFLGQQTVSWQVERLAGAPRIGSFALKERGFLAVGQWIETDESSRAKIEVGLVGHVEVEPNSRLGLLRAGVTEHRLALDRGKLSARIKAPPRLFIVETPAATAVDLGCAYTLEVDDTGASLLRVSQGWVSFEWKGRESTIPFGAACYARAGRGPGTPYYEDSSKLFQNALDRLDFENGGPADLEVLLAESRIRDSMTLWHLLSRLDGPVRIRVYDRLAKLVDPPPDVSRDGILRLDTRMLQLWKDKIDRATW